MLGRKMKILIFYKESEINTAPEQQSLLSNSIFLKKMLVVYKIRHIIKYIPTDAFTWR